MAAKSKIEWTDATLNFWYGCHKISDGCTYCYMFRDMPRYGWDPNVVTRSKTFYDSLKWAKSGKLAPGSRIFVCSWGDFFIEEADGWRDEAWDIIKQTPQFNYLILTKRIENVPDRLPSDWGDGYPNVWHGVTVESDKYIWRIEELLKIPAAKRFVSLEPMLGGIQFKDEWFAETYDCENCRNTGHPWIECGNELSGYDYRYECGCKDMPFIDWVIIGAESGAKRRRMDIFWAIDTVKQCKAAGVPVFVKQIHLLYKKSRKKYGTILSKDMDDWPEDLRIRQWPE